MPRGKENLRSQAILLRRKGYSYELIKNKIGVSKSTLCDWLKKIPYKANLETLARMNRGRIKATKTIRFLKLNRDQKTINLARLELGKISIRDLMMIGIGLYIGEGGKYNNGFIQFSNSDPKVIKLMMNWFIKILRVDINNFYMIVHIYPDNNINNVLKFWSQLTDVPMYQFGKTYVDRRVNKSVKNKGKLKYGTLHIRVRGLEKYAKIALFQRVLTWIEIVENDNFAGIV